jgi:ATP-dependent Lhr-like helicase
VSRHRHGADALLDVIEQLQGAPIAASILETEILPARIAAYDPADLDAVASAGEVVWTGVESLGARDGRIALYLADQLPRLLPPAVRLKPETDEDPRETAIVEFLRTHGASYFGPLHDAVGGGYPDETVAALWRLVWNGVITNDTFHALRAFANAHAPRRRQRRGATAPFRSRRLAPPSAEGRWTIVRSGDADTKGRATAWATAWTKQLLARHGVLTREAVMSESSPGGFGVVYPVLKALEDAGRIRRGYFVAGLGATQFALPGALDLLRSLRDPSPGIDEDVRVVVLSATDPANPYGATLKFPASVNRSPARIVGATVILTDGAIAAWLARGDRQLVTFLPEGEPERTKRARGIAQVLIDRAREGGDSPRGMLLEEIDGMPAAVHPLAPFLAAAGFVGGALGFQATFHARR